MITRALLSPLSSSLPVTSLFVQRCWSTVCTQLRFAVSHAVASTRSRPIDV